MANVFDRPSADPDYSVLQTEAGHLAGDSVAGERWTESVGSSVPPPSMEGSQPARGHEPGNTGITGAQQRRQYMTYQTYQYDQDTGIESGAGFLMGLLSGVVLGVGVGMLLAPRAGAELRQNLAQSASDLSHKVRETAEKGREVLNRKAEDGREAVHRTDEMGREALNRTRENWSDMRQESQVGSTSSTSQTPSTGSGYVS
jgi:gas vesicle protein